MKRPALLTRACLPLLLSAVLTITTGAAAQGTPVPAVPTSVPRAVAAPNVPAAAIPGIPTLPDVVTVVPFQLDQTWGWVNVPAELDGHRGTFLFDTGSHRFWLNAQYLRRSATGGIDTLSGDEAEEGDVTVHTLHIGTFVQHLDSSGVGPPVPPRPTNGMIHGFGEPRADLGTLGLQAMEPFETIIDYPHQRLILIRLDKQGRRLAAVPAYTPRATVPLVPAQGTNWWGLAGHKDSAIDSVLVDTGEPGIGPDKSPEGQRNAANQLLQAVATGHDTSVMDLNEILVLGYPFLRQLAVVGFNLRTRQLILYH